MNIGQNAFLAGVSAACHQHGRARLATGLRQQPRHIEVAPFRQ